MSEKHIGFLYATKEGKHPSTIYPNRVPVGTMQLCKKYKPNENWKVFEIILVGDKLKVVGQTKAFAIGLFQEIIRLHRGQLIDIIKVKLGE